MNIGAKSWATTIISLTGAALAGPSGALVGKLAGELLTTILPGAARFVRETFGSAAAGTLATKAIEHAQRSLVQRLAPHEQQQINHDLQTAFRDAFQQALYDLGGKQCFPQAWRHGRAGVPSTVPYPSTTQGNRLWHQQSPLAEHVCAYLQQMQHAVVQQRLLPLEPPRDQPAA
ncbi:MAG: hypothetical protein M3380_07130, partial [Chloroflexota bacterium]|nr:hypothetical protein [Chloroflexota bacterium]